MRPIALAAALVLGACRTQDAPIVARFDEAPLSVRSDQSHAPLRPGACHARDQIPTPTAHSGSAAPREIWFETPCRDVWTPEFVATLQRALIARGHMAGPATEAMTPEAFAAVRRYQSAQGIDSDILSLAAAKRLGLVAYARDEAL